MWITTTSREQIYLGNQDKTGEVVKACFSLTVRTAAVKTWKQNAESGLLKWGKGNKVLLFSMPYLSTNWHRSSKAFTSNRKIAGCEDATLWKTCNETGTCVLSHFRRVRLYATLWTVPCQTPLAVRFSRQDYWSGLQALLQGIFPTKGSNPSLLSLRHWQSGSLLLVPPVTGMEETLEERIWGSWKLSSCQQQPRGTHYEHRQLKSRVWANTCRSHRRLCCPGLWVRAPEHWAGPGTARTQWALMISIHQHLWLQYLRS